MSKNNIYWNVSLFNSTNAVVGKSLELNNKATEFVNLRNTNEQLAEENAFLRKQLTDKMELYPVIEGYNADSLIARRFSFNIAKVIGSTANLTDNFITIDKGEADGIKPGMGVVAPLGIVGQVSNTSKHYARIYSLLHSNMRVSAEVKNATLQEDETIALGTIQWDGTNPNYVNLNNIDRFKPIAIGDTVYTSMQNAIYPQNIMIGIVKEVANDPSEAFHKIKVKLSTDFSGLMYVYVVDNKFVEEQLELEE